MGNDSEAGNLCLERNVVVVELYLLRGGLGRGSSGSSGVGIFFGPTESNIKGAAVESPAGDAGVAVGPLVDMDLAKNSDLGAFGEVLSEVLPTVAEHGDVDPLSFLLAGDVNGFGDREREYEGVGVGGVAEFGIFAEVSDYHGFHMLVSFF